jgi:hypothetical protein
MHLVNRAICRSRYLLAFTVLLAAMAASLTVAPAARASTVFAPNAITIAGRFTPAPPVSGTATTLTLTLTGPTGRPLSGVKVTAEVNMTDMDMGTTSPAFKSLGKGHYAAMVNFSMSGPWAVKVHVKGRNIDATKVIVVQVTGA